jgi:pimeloyl-ACP methyl ester carboxylesterase
MIMSLAFERRGGGIPLVLLHGFPFNRSMWSEQVESLSRVADLILPDLPGHGESPLGPLPLSMDGMADSVVALLDDLGVNEPAVVGGLSMGGYVAQAIAARHPGRVRALILADTKSAPDSPEAAAQREILAKKVEEADDPAPARDGMLPKLLAPASAASRPELVERVASMISGTAPASIAATLRALATRPDRGPELSSWDWPALVVVGDQDAIATPEEMRGIADRLPRATFSVIPEAGHLPPVEQPAAFNAAVLEFLGRIKG